MVKSPQNHPSWDRQGKGHGCRDWLGFAFLGLMMQGKHIRSDLNREATVAHVLLISNTCALFFCHSVGRGRFFCSLFFFLFSGCAAVRISPPRSAYTPVPWRCFSYRRDVPGKGGRKRYRHRHGLQVPPPSPSAPRTRKDHARHNHRSGA